MATIAARKRWSQVIFRNAVETWWESWSLLWQEIGSDIRRKTPPRSVDEYIDRRYERLDAHDEEAEHDAHEIDPGFGGDAAGTGGQD